MTRRGFISSILGLWGTVLSLPFIYVFIEYLAPPRRKFKPYSERLNPKSNIQEVSLEKLQENSSMYLVIEDEPVLLIRSEGEKITALSATCTHLDCLIGYSKSNRIITCNCHGSSFNTEGIPLEGPAKRPLKKYDAQIKNGIIYVNGDFNG